MATVDALAALEDKIDAGLRTATERINQTDERLTSFTETYEASREQDMLAFADQSERADFTSNQSKANFVLITGKI